LVFEAGSGVEPFKLESVVIIIGLFKLVLRKGVSIGKVA
jgi:hypothetical protein